MRTLGKIQLVLFATVLLLNLAASLARAGEGGMSSGGGGAFVLRDGGGKVLKAELLDLWEAKNVLVPRLEIVYSEAPVQSQVLSAIKKLEKIDNFFYRGVMESLAYLQNPKNIDDKPEEVEITTPEDARNKYKKRGWPLEGMFLFDGETKKLSRKKEIFDALITKTDKAAAWVHEAVYMEMRKAPTSAKDSIQARRLTACLFAKKCLPTQTTEESVPLDREVYFCKSENGHSELYVWIQNPKGAQYPDPDGKVQLWRLMVSRAGERVYGVPTYVEFDGTVEKEVLKPVGNGKLGGGLRPWGVKIEYETEHGEISVPQISLPACQKIR